MTKPDSILPQPIITAVSRPFWDGCLQGVLRVQRCAQCSRYRFYPSETCPACASPDYAWQEVSGKGRVASWIVIHRSVDPAWSARTPFASGVVEIDEQSGCFIPGVIEGIAPSLIRAGQRVEVRFERVSESTALPRWQVLNAQ